jgi:hypothetical protein
VKLLCGDIHTSLSGLPLEVLGQRDNIDRWIQPHVSLPLLIFNSEFFVPAYSHQFSGLLAEVEEKRRDKVVSVIR